MNTQPKPALPWYKKIDIRILLAVFILAGYGLYWGSFDNFVRAIDHCEIAFCDFQSFYYPAGQAVLEHTAIPNGFYYSSFAAILFAPLALFTQQTAAILWGVVQAMAVAGLVLLPSRGLFRTRATQVVYTLLCLVSTAVLNNFKWGQISIFLVLGIWGAFQLHAQKKRTLSAILLGAVIALKYFPIVFLLYFIFKRDWKYLGICLASVLVCLVLVPVTVLGPQMALEYLLHSSGGAAQMVTTLATQNTGTQYFASAFTRWLGLGMDSGFFKALSVLGFLLVVPIFVFMARVARSGVEHAGLWSCGLIFMSLPFWIPSAWPHYFVYLPILLAMLFQEMTRQGARLRKTTFLLWLLAALFASILTAEALQDWFTYVWLGLPLWSNLLTLFLTLQLLGKPTNPARLPANP